MFNETNVDNRRLELVRGRVIVVTTSRHVEFLQENLKRSFPLYSVDSLPAGKLLTFCVELNGYLTFEEGSFVKILESPLPFERIYYDPSAFAIVQPADPSMLVSVSYNYAAGNANAIFVRVFRSLANDTTVEEDFYPGTIDVSEADFKTAIARTFVPGSVWAGPNGYAPFSQNLNIN